MVVKIASTSAAHQWPFQAHWRYLFCKVYVRAMVQGISRSGNGLDWPGMLQYLQFRYLEWPLLNFTLTNFAKREPKEKEHEDLRATVRVCVCV